MSTCPARAVCPDTRACRAQTTPTRCAGNNLAQWVRHGGPGQGIEHLLPKARSWGCGCGGRLVRGRAGGGAGRGLEARKPLVEQEPRVTSVRTAVRSRTCFRNPSRNAMAASCVSAEPVSISCLPVTGSVPPKTRTWNAPPRWRTPVRSTSLRLLAARPSSVPGDLDSLLDEDRESGSSGRPSSQLGRWWAPGGSNPEPAD
jgi:hypothetical protein